MIINSLSLKNFRNFEDLEVGLSEGVNLFVGINGSGKTALLEAINLVSGCYLLQNPVVKHYPISNDQAHLEFENQQFLARYPVSVGGQLRMFYPEDEFIGSVSREKSGRNGRTTTANTYFASNLGWTHYRDSRNKKNILPLISFYSTQRLHVSRKKTESTKGQGKFEGYYNCLDYENNLKHLVAWWQKAETDELKEQQIDRSFSDGKLKMVKSVLKRVLNEDSESGFEPNFYFNLKLGEIIVVYPNGERKPFSRLSDGYRNLIGLFADLAFRIGTLNYNVLGKNSLKETYGVVTIDEIDLHLHPQWQSKAISLLQEIFPKVQFFITTHSPIVVSSFNKGHLYTIENNKVILQGSFYGKDINTTISDLFRAHERGAKEVQDKTDEFQTLMGTKAFASPRYKTLKTELAKILGNLDPLLIRAATLEKLFGK